MNREEIIRMAREAGFRVDWQHADVAEIKAKRYEYFAALVAAAEREKVARWHIDSGYATGHGDTIEGLLEELEREIGFKRAELWIKRINEAVLAEREQCATIAKDWDKDHPNTNYGGCIAAAIRARSKS